MLKNKKEIVNYGILVKFWISNISNFPKKNHNFAEFFDKILDPYNQKHKNFKNFLMTTGR